MVKKLLASGAIIFLFLGSVLFYQKSSFFHDFKFKQVLYYLSDKNSHAPEPEKGYAPAQQHLSLLYHRRNQETEAKQWLNKAKQNKTATDFLNMHPLLLLYYVTQSIRV